MGFRVGSYCKVWEVDQKSDKLTSLRISISTKNRESGEYEQVFGGYVACIGTAAAQKAARLKQGDTIRLGNITSRTKWVAAQKKEYRDDNIYSFYVEGEPEFTAKLVPNFFDTGSTSKTRREVDSGTGAGIDDGEPEDPNSNLPF